MVDTIIFLHNVSLTMGEEMGWEGGETSWDTIVVGLQGGWEAGSMVCVSGIRSWEVAGG